MSSYCLSSPPRTLNDCVNNRKSLPWIFTVTEGQEAAIALLFCVLFRLASSQASLGMLFQSSNSDLLRSTFDGQSSSSHVPHPFMALCTLTLVVPVTGLPSSIILQTQWRNLMDPFAQVPRKQPSIISTKATQQSWLPCPLATI